MAYIYNITFVTSPDCYYSLLEWLRQEAIPVLFGDGTGAAAPCMRTVLESGGEAPGPDHGVSVTLQGEFDTLEAAHDWQDSILPGVLGDLHRKFGQNALFFTTLLETLPV